jgi:hypothetical protein
MVRKMAKLAPVALLELVTHLTLCVGSNLFELTVQDSAFAQARVVD